ncbi:MAG: hypothetical protein ACFB2W_00325 [Leptolyngbyaceae cyanobacterium]
MGFDRITPTWRQSKRATSQCTGLVHRTNKDASSDPKSSLYQHVAVHAVSGEALEKQTQAETLAFSVSNFHQSFSQLPDSAKASQSKESKPGPIQKNILAKSNIEIVEEKNRQITKQPEVQETIRSNLSSPDPLVRGENIQFHQNKSNEIHTATGNNAVQMMEMTLDEEIQDPTNSYANDHLQRDTTSGAEKITYTSHLDEAKQWMSWLWDEPLRQQADSNTQIKESALGENLTDADRWRLRELIGIYGEEVYQRTINACSINDIREVIFKLIPNSIKKQWNQPQFKERLHKQKPALWWGLDLRSNPRDKVSSYNSIGEKAKWEYVGTVGEFMNEVRLRHRKQVKQETTWIIPHPDGSGSAGIDLVILKWAEGTGYRIVAHEVKMPVKTREQTSYGFGGGYGDDKKSGLPQLYRSNYNEEGEQRQKPKQLNQYHQPQTQEEYLIELLDKASEVPRSVKNQVIPLLKARKIPIKWKYAIIGHGKVDSNFESKVKPTGKLQGKQGVKTWIRRTASYSQPRQDIRQKQTTKLMGLIQKVLGSKYFENFKSTKYFRLARQFLDDCQYNNIKLEDIARWVIQRYRESDSYHNVELLSEEIEAEYKRLTEELVREDQSFSNPKSTSSGGWITPLRFTRTPQEMAQANANRKKFWIINEQLAALRSKKAVLESKKQEIADDLWDFSCNVDSLKEQFQQTEGTSDLMDIDGVVSLAQVKQKLLDIAGNWMVDLKKQVARIVPPEDKVTAPIFESEWKKQKSSFIKWFHQQLSSILHYYPKGVPQDTYEEFLSNFYQACCDEVESMKVF